MLYDTRFNNPRLSNMACIKGDVEKLKRVSHKSACTLETCFSSRVNKKTICGPKISFNAVINHACVSVQSGSFLPLIPSPSRSSSSPTDRRHGDGLQFVLG